MLTGVDFTQPIVPQSVIDQASFTPDTTKPALTITVRFNQDELNVLQIAQTDVTLTQAQSTLNLAPETAT